MLCVHNKYFLLNLQTQKDELERNKVHYTRFSIKVSGIEFN